MAVNSDTGGDEMDGKRQLPQIDSLLTTGFGGRYLASVLSFHPRTSLWERRYFFFTDEELRLYVVPNSLGGLTWHQNLEQSDNETVPSLTQILKIAKNDPSYPVANDADKFELSRRCLWSHVLLMEKAGFS